MIEGDIMENWVNVISSLLKEVEHHDNLDLENYTR